MGRAIIMMPRVAVFAVALALVASTSLAQDDYEMTGDPDKDGQHEMQEMDGDKDGKVTLDEVKAFMKKSYYSNDEDLKGLENEEGKPASPEDITKMIEQDATELMKELDTDSSDDLSLEEIVAQYKDTEGMEEGDEAPEDMPDDE